MKERRNIRYISGRIWWMGMVVLALLVILTVTQAVLFFQGQGPLWNVLLTVAVLIGYLIAAVFWISRPYQQAEKTMERFLEGYMVMAGDGARAALLTPTTAEEMKFMEHFLHSPQMMDLNKRQAQYLALQNQINPHFLYNTLDTMSGIANAQNCPLVSGMCRSLSAIFRYSLNMADELSTMQNEMAHVRNYLYVMDVRNGSAIAYDYQIDSDTLQDQMPRICIQPVVENALSHGLRNVRRKDKKLLIRSEHIDENLVITVSDNGAGMDSESMNRLLEQNDMKRVESGVSIGILNVNARLKNLFGDEYGLHIESTMGEGTTVTITVPAIATENIANIRLTE